MKQRERGRHAAPRGRRRAAWWWPLVVLAACAAATLVTTGAEGGFSGSVTNTGDAAQSGTLLTSGASGGTSECNLASSTTATISAANTATCTGGLAASGTLPTTGTSALSTAVAADGSLSGTAASLQTGACGPVQMNNGGTQDGDPMLVRGNAFTYAQAGPTTLTGSGSLGFSGSSAYTSDVSDTSPATGSFTELIWFKTTAGATTGGTLMGFANVDTSTGATSSDKMLWIDDTGHVVFGLDVDGTNTEVTSSGTYNDGNWHLAVATFGTGDNLKLYIDGGTPVVQGASATATSYSGYWHIGWDSYTTNSGWSDPPTDSYFTGSLSDAAVLPSTLTASQITTLYGEVSQTYWATKLGEDGATDTWPLADNGSTIYTGTVPGVTPAPCAFVDATVGLSAPSASCTVPSSAAACATPSSTTTLATVGGSGTTPFEVAPAVGTPITVVVTLERDATDTTSAYPNATGLHLTLPLSVIVTASSFSATLMWPAENVVL